MKTAIWYNALNDTHTEETVLNQEPSSSTWWEPVDGMYTCAQLLEKSFSFWPMTNKNYTTTHTWRQTLSNSFFFRVKTNVSLLFAPCRKHSSQFRLLMHSVVGATIIFQGRLRTVMGTASAILILRWRPVSHCWPDKKKRCKLVTIYCTAVTGCERYSYIQVFKVRSNAHMNT